MSRPNPPAPKYATMRDYDVAHLLGGPDSDRLEFNSAYYEAEFGPLPGRPYVLVDFLRENPDFITDNVVQLAAFTAMEFYNRTSTEVGKSGAERRYLEAGHTAVAAYIESGRNPVFTVDAVVFRTGLTIPVAELREAGRCAVQHLQVYEAVMATGEVPEL